MKKIVFILATTLLFIAATSFAPSCVKQEPIRPKSFMQTHPAPLHTINVSYYSYTVSAGIVWIRIFLDAPSDGYHQVILQTDYIRQNGAAATFNPDIEVFTGDTTAEEGYGGNEGAGHGFYSTVLLIL